MGAREWKEVGVGLMGEGRGMWRWEGDRVERG